MIGEFGDWNYLSSAVLCVCVCVFAFKEQFNGKNQFLEAE